ncbi:interleukin-like EMT inducer domain-containing protein, partial [Clostridium perfringens]
FNEFNNVMSAQTFDVYGNGEAAAGRGWVAMRDFLNGIQNGPTVIITTGNEPRNNRTNDGLREAMERCGAGDLFYNPSDPTAFR